jgi:Flp pilus assembly protein TadD
VRHPLGAALLKAGRANEAEAVYREDLKRFPANGWALTGLVQSLKAQGKPTDAAEAELRTAWKDADLALAGSRF